MSERPLLSIVIPAYNEESRLPDSLEQVTGFVATQPYLAEVIVVDNNSTDRTSEIAHSFAERFPFVRALFEPTQGKGAAVRKGMLAGKGEYLFICDADLSMPIEEVNKFIPPRLRDYDIAIGSREAPGAVRYDEPVYRHLMGRVFNLIVQMIAVPGLRDTQCGFKSFRREVALDLFEAQTMMGWTFDVELLFIARRRGYKVVEVPIHWYYRPHSRVHPIRDSINMLKDVIRIRINGWRGVYG